jgi:AcrR family transcriptional regulator
MAGQRRQQQKEETRRILLEAAYALFSQKGYGQTTMRALADKAGVAQGTIFKHFPDKSALVVAAFESDVGRVVEQAFASLPRANLNKQLMHLTRRLYGFYAQNPPLSRVLVREGMLMEGEGGRAPAATQQAFLVRVAGLVQAAVGRGELPGATDVLSAVMAFGSFYIAALVVGLQAESFNPAGQARLVGRLWDLLCQGLGGPEPKTAG